MSNVKFPLLSGKESNFPDKPLCPWCKTNKIFEPNSFAFINAGAVLMDRQKDVGKSSTSMDAYFTIGWHGAHLEESGEGQYANIYENIDLAEEVIGGQLGLYFCSTKCMRSFLNFCIDELEKKVQTAFHKKV